MLSLAEFSRATYGAWRLALMDADGLRYFDDTLEAYWRSFQAAVILIPAYAILAATRLTAIETEAGLMRIILVEAIAYTINWVAFPLAMIHVCRRIQRFDRYLRYITAHNWSAVIQVTVFLIAMTLATGVFGAGPGTVMIVGASLAILFYQWFIARAALSVGGMAAAAIVGLDLAISVVLNAVTGRLI